MIKITKHNLPIFLNEELKRLKRYKSLRGNLKKSVRQELLISQRSLCCYCMCKIHIRNMQIEHFKPQSKYRELDTDWTNLYGVCKGIQEKKTIHCDKSKSNILLPLELDPVNIDETNIFYDRNGNIGFIQSSPKIDKGVNDILKLNNQSLKNIRKSVLRALIEKQMKEPQKYKSFILFKIQINEEYLGIYKYISSKM